MPNYGANMRNDLMKLSSGTDAWRWWVGMLVMSLLCLCLCQGCTSYQNVILDKELATERLKKPILLLPPVSSKVDLKKYCGQLGKEFYVELSRETENRAVYALNVEALDPSLTWDNLIINGEINSREVAAMARDSKCPSAIVCDVLDVNNYPPQRTVLRLQWIDAETGKSIGILYNNVDASDAKTKYIYGNFIGHGPAKMLYEQFAYSEDLMQTALLSPDRFRQFVAAYSVQLLIGKADVGFWYRFWNVM